MYDIESTTKVSSEVQHYFSGNEVTVIGLALSAKDKEKANITFEISKSNETLTEELAKNMKSVALDMKASGGGITSSKLDIPVYITIPLPKGLSGEGLRLFHIHNGETEELNVQVEDEKVSFTTDGFSSFIFAEKKRRAEGIHQVAHQEVLPERISWCLQYQKHLANGYRLYKDGSSKN